MSAAPDLPPWAAVTAALLLFLGSGFTLVGGIGLLRLRTFYQRVHAPTLGSTGGIVGIALASIIRFSNLDSGIALRAVVVFIFLTMTVPVGLMLLARAALFRDRVEGNPEVPPPLGLVTDGTEAPGGTVI